MIIVTLGLEIHQQRWRAMQHQCAGSDEGPLDAMAAILVQCHAHGIAGVPVRLAVARHVGDEILDLLRRRKPGEDRRLLRGQADFPGEPPVECHAYIPSRVTEKSRRAAKIETV